MENRTKICSKCNVEKPVNGSFGTRVVRGNTYPTAQCHKCRYQVRRDKGRQRSERSLRLEAEQTRARSAKYRVNPTKRAQHILSDSSYSDRKKGFINDLDIEFIAATIAKPCSYCDDDDSQKGLDRIDNSLGHLKSYVVVSCIRSNLVRGNMPHLAWLELCDGMRSARIKGLFGEWNGKFKKK